MFYLLYIAAHHLESEQQTMPSTPHPIQRAMNAWKTQQGEQATDAEFAKFVGYADPDALYKQIRGQYLAPYNKIEKMAEVLGWSGGRFLNECRKWQLRQETTGADAKEDRRAGARR